MPLRRHSTSVARCCNRPFAYCTCAEDKERYERKVTVTRYRKTALVEAMQWDGTLDSIKTICRWANDGAEEPWIDYITKSEDEPPSDVMCHTLEGPLNVSPGDWIIQGVQGEYHPCKPDVFAASYAPVVEDALEGKQK